MTEDSLKWFLSYNLKVGRRTYRQTPTRRIDIRLEEVPDNGGCHGSHQARGADTVELDTCTTTIETRWKETSVCKHPRKTATSVPREVKRLYRQGESNFSRPCNDRPYQGGDRSSAMRWAIPFEVIDQLIFSPEIRGCGTGNLGTQTLTRAAWVRRLRCATKG